MFDQLYAFLLYEYGNWKSLDVYATSILTFPVDKFFLWW